METIVKTIPRMRTINEAYDFIKNVDKDTAITKNWIRGLCQNKEISTFKIGKKTLLNIDDLLKKIESNLK